MAALHKREMLEAWRHRWSNQPTNPSSGFHPANKLPPTLSPTKRFQNSDRKTFSRLIQFRSGHAHIGEYYKRFITTEDPSCTCGHATQTRRHILKECPKYLHQRPLLGTGRNAQLERLVGTEKGITRLAKFISISKAIDKHNTTRTRTPDQNNEPTDGERRGEG